MSPSVLPRVRGRSIRPRRYEYSVDGGSTWVLPAATWPNRYECNQLPAAAGWTLVEGRTGYESVSNGILRFNDTSTASGTKAKYARSWSVNSSVGATVLARMYCARAGTTSATTSMSPIPPQRGAVPQGQRDRGLYQYNALIPGIRIPGTCTA